MNAEAVYENVAADPYGGLRQCMVCMQTIFPYEDPRKCPRGCKRRSWAEQIVQEEDENIFAALQLAAAGQI